MLKTLITKMDHDIKHQTNAMHARANTHTHTHTSKHARTLYRAPKTYNALQSTCHATEEEGLLGSPA